MYPSLELWESEFQALDAAEAELTALQGKVKSSSDVIRALTLRDDISRKLHKLYAFAHLKADEDTTHGENQGRLDRIQGRYAKLQAAGSWIDPELLALSPDTIRGARKQKGAEPFQRSLDLLERYRPHTLTSNEERMLSLASEPLHSAQKIFSMLNEADMKFGKIKNDRGQEVELTHGNAIQFLESPKRSVRAAAFQARCKAYGAVEHAMAAALDGNVKAHVFSAKVRKFPSALEASLFDDHVHREVYDGLIREAHAALPTLYKYFELRRKRLKLKKLDMYDLFVPIIPKFDIKVPIELGQQWILEALEPMGPEYQALLKRAFSERWVDYLENKGKRSGAYSSGCYDSAPYILMNYTENLSGVFTLAHELGHSLHTALANSSQPHATAGYTIFVAEVASITNEMLLSHYLLKKYSDAKKHKSFRSFLLMHQCDEFRTTFFRQTMFAEFERDIHAKVEAGVPLTKDELCRSYLEMNQTYHGKAVKPDSQIALEWARIPHFYYNFYVYKYATGFAAAQAFAERILQGVETGDSTARDAYLGFLRSGGSRDPLDLLAAAGVDLRKPEPIRMAMGRFERALSELTRILR